jgi:hypothetical protein
MRVRSDHAAAVLLAVIVCSDANLYAADPTQRPTDAQSAIEPRSQPGAGQRFLERFVGEWKVTKRFYPRSGDPTEATGTCHQKMIHDGRFLESEFVFEQEGKKITGLGIIGFDTESGKFTSVWTDARATRMSIRQSNDRFNGEEIVLYSHPANPNIRQSRPSRTNTHFEDDGHRIVHRQYTSSEDGKDRLILEIDLERVAPLP